MVHSLNIRQNTRYKCLATTSFNLLAALLFTVILSSCNVNEPSSLEERAQAIDKQLMCPFCPAETIDQAQVPQARDMRQFVRDKLSEGWTDQEILDYFSAPERYGTKVLAKPPKSGANLLIWIVPPAGLSIGGLLVLLIVNSMKKRHHTGLARIDRNRNEATHE